MQTNPVSNTSLWRAQETYFPLYPVTNQNSLGGEAPLQNVKKSNVFVWNFGGHFIQCWITFVWARPESSENYILFIAYNIFKTLLTSLCDGLMAMQFFGLSHKHTPLPPWWQECSHSSIFKDKYNNTCTSFAKLLFVPERLMFVASDIWGWKLQLWQAGVMDDFSWTHHSNFFTAFK